MIDNRWKFRLASALQKSIRRGDTDLAGRLAVALQEASSPWYARHRLQIVACEDAFGDPEQACDIVLRCYDKKADVRELASRLASLPKCRVATDVLLTLDTAETKSLTVEFAGQPVPDAVSKVAALQDHSLAGFQGAVVLAAQIVAQSDGELIDEAPDPDVMVAGLPSASFDQHCQEGRRSLAYFSKACAPVASFFAKHPELGIVDALGFTLFEVEGGLCNSRLTSPLIEEVRQRALLLCAWSSGGMTLDQYTELAAIVSSNMPLLHKSRARVLSAIDAGPAPDSAQSDLPL